MKKLDFQLLDRLIDLAFLEDIGPGDITSESIFEHDEQGYGKIIAKEDLVLSGIDVAERVFIKTDPKILVEKKRADGDHLKKGDTILLLEGSMVSLLKGERTSLNFLQRMSGIATNTSKYVKTLKNFPDVKIADTRKTIPGLRVLEKYSVAVGGGSNHRTGLYDGVIIKDNHIEATGSITSAILRVKKTISHLVKIEVEVKNMDEVKEALEAGADVIMLDNMNTKEIQESVSFIDKRIPVEVSGNVTLERLHELASTGVDIISSGALIHHAVFTDISMYISRQAMKE